MKTFDTQLQDVVRDLKVNNDFIYRINIKFVTVNTDAVLTTCFSLKVKTGYTFQPPSWSPSGVITNPTASPASTKAHPEQLRNLQLLCADLK
jgi:hypothetical protein